LDKRAVICIVFVNGIDENAIFPFCSTLSSKFIIVEEVCGHKSFGLYPTMITGNDALGGLVVLLITGNASENGLLYDRNLVLI
jgi:hypothetical protein